MGYESERLHEVLERPLYRAECVDVVASLRLGVKGALRTAPVADERPCATQISVIQLVHPFRLWVPFAAPTTAAVLQLSTSRIE